MMTFTTRAAGNSVAYNWLAAARHYLGGHRAHVEEEQTVPRGAHRRRGEVLPTGLHRPRRRRGDAVPSGRRGVGHVAPLRPIEAASERAKISPTVNFHCLRHTWASHAVMNGVSLMVVARNLGHVDTRMVEKHPRPLGRKLRHRRNPRRRPVFRCRCRPDYTNDPAERMGSNSLLS
jgi:integrase